MCTQLLNLVNFCCPKFACKYRVETLFTPDFQVKKRPNSLKIDIFHPFLKYNISRIYGIHSLGKISAVINDGLDMEPEAAAGVGEKLARQISKKIVHFE